MARTKKTTKKKEIEVIEQDIQQEQKANEISKIDNKVKNITVNKAQSLADFLY